MIRLLTLALTLCLIAPLPSYAQEDDGPPQQGMVKETPIEEKTLDEIREEMKREAAGVHAQCAANPYHSIYFNCECLGGAFLIEREKQGPFVPQYDIFDQLTRGPKATCANTENIAMKSYISCLDYAETFREMNRDNKEYCECVGNRVANTFTKRPRLSPTYVEGITLNAMLFCDKPENRPKR